MSVIIRLQNLPWSANALDIRQFFKGLSIPDGGVHIVGGEMGDAFIAFSTDEDARLAMMRDREPINGIQVRLLLSSRAEMQKVIEMARHQSLLALKNAATAAPVIQKVAPIVAAVKPEKASVVAQIPPQPPIITTSSFPNILKTPSFLAYQKQAGIQLVPETPSKLADDLETNSGQLNNAELNTSRERRRSDSRERRRSRSRTRSRERSSRHRRESRSRSRERDYRSNRGRRSARRSRSRERRRSRERSHERSRDRSRERSLRNRDYDGYRESSSHNNKSNNARVGLDDDNKSKQQHISPWNVPLTNAYQTNTMQNQLVNNASMVCGNENVVKKPIHNLSETLQAAVAATGVLQTHNLSHLMPVGANKTAVALNNFLSGNNNNNNNINPFKNFSLQNPYTTTSMSVTGIANASQDTTKATAIPGIFLEKKSEATAGIVMSTYSSNTGSGSTTNSNANSGAPITFANTNPYEKIYPSLFAQAAAMSSGQKLSTNSTQATAGERSSPPQKTEMHRPKRSMNETTCIKISNMCASTTYSDLRKFFTGLFIPHNGIKMINDKHGLRSGLAYVQFTRANSVPKALLRNMAMLKGKSVLIESISDEEFEHVEDSYRPMQREFGGGNFSSDGTASPAYSVLYIEDIPALATEQDVMKMFSSFTLYDILLMCSPENRREFVAYVRFTREEDAKAALENKSRHQIGYRRVRVRPGTLEDMEKTKEKIRLANEQLVKEEKAAAAAAAAVEAAAEAKAKEEEELEKKQAESDGNTQSIHSFDLTTDDDENVYDGEDNDKNKGDKIKEESCEEGFDNMEMETQSEKGANDSEDTNQGNANAMDNTFTHSNSSNDLRFGGVGQNANDPRLRRIQNESSDNNRQLMTSPNSNNFNNFNMNFNQGNNQQPLQQAGPQFFNNTINNIENNFVLLKNCDYNARITDVAQLFLSANLNLKHVELLRNERELPSGEFIVEFRRMQDAEIAVKDFHNTQFRGRGLRVYTITPQEIADRLGKPFLQYVPGGSGPRSHSNNGSNMSNQQDKMKRNNFGGHFNNGDLSRGMSNSRGGNLFGNSMRNMLRNDLSNNDDNNNSNNGGGIPEKFTRPGCVLSMENVPYKAQISDILQYFNDFNLTPDDIIRRFNDDGTPTGDARVAFSTPDVAKAALTSRRRKQIFKRTIHLKIL